MTTTHNELGESGNYANPPIEYMTEPQKEVVISSQRTSHKISFYLSKYVFDQVTINPFNAFEKIEKGKVLICLNGKEFIIEGEIIAPFKLNRHASIELSGQIIFEDENPRKSFFKTACGILTPLKRKYSYFFTEATILDPSRRLPSHPVLTPYFRPPPPPPPPAPPVPAHHAECLSILHYKSDNTIQQALFDLYERLLRPSLSSFILTLAENGLQLLSPSLPPLSPPFSPLPPSLSSLSFSSLTDLELALIERRILPKQPRGEILYHDIFPLKNTGIIVSAIFDHHTQWLEVAAIGKRFSSAHHISSYILRHDIENVPLVITGRRKEFRRLKYQKAIRLAKAEVKETDLPHWSREESKGLESLIYSKGELVHKLLGYEDWWTTVSCVGYLENVLGKEGGSAYMRRYGEGESLRALPLDDVEYEIRTGGQGWGSLRPDVSGFGEWSEFDIRTGDKWNIDWYMTVYLRDGKPYVAKEYDPESVFFWDTE